MVSWLSQEEDLRQFAKFPELVKLLEAKSHKVITKSRGWKHLLERISQENKNFTDLIRKFGSAVKQDNLDKVQRVVSVLGGRGSSTSSTTSSPQDANPQANLGLDEDEDEEEEEAEEKSKDEDEEESNEDEDEEEDQGEDESAGQQGLVPQASQKQSPIRKVKAATTSQRSKDGAKTSTTSPSKEGTSLKEPPGSLGIDNDSVEDDD